MIIRIQIHNIFKVSKKNISYPQNAIHNPPNNFLYDLTNIKLIDERLADLKQKIAKKETKIQVS